MGGSKINISITIIAIIVTTITIITIITILTITTISTTITSITIDKIILSTNIIVISQGSPFLSSCNNSGLIHTQCVSLGSTKDPKPRTLSKTTSAVTVAHRDFADSDAHDVASCQIPKP